MGKKRNKFSFLSIPSIFFQTEEARKVITDNTVLKLERGVKELFGRSWNEQ